MHDFYVVLPSNACGEKHPENHASKYIVSWENPIDLQSDLSSWRVALTDITFNNVFKSVIENQGFDFIVLEDIEVNFAIEVVFDEVGKNLKYSWVEDRVFRKGPGYRHLAVNFHEHFNIAINKDNKLEITNNFADWQSWTLENIVDHGNTDSHNSKFKKMNVIPTSVKTNYNNSELLKIIGISSLPLRDIAVQKFVGDREIINKDLVKGRTLTFKFKALYKDKIESPRSFRFDDSITFQNETKLIHYFFLKFVSLIKFTQAKKGDPLNMRLSPRLKQITFVNGLNFTLGFDKTTYISDGDEHKIFYANHKVQLRRGISNMYVYASICSPIQVGDVRVPLLKSIWMDKNTDDGATNDNPFGKIIHRDIKNPMYVPLSTSSINSIELNIRTDSGNLVPFSEGSVTSLTLHFKNINKL